MAVETVLLALRLRAHLESGPIHYVLLGLQIFRITIIALATTLLFTRSTNIPNIASDEETAPLLGQPQRHSDNAETIDTLYDSLGGSSWGGANVEYEDTSREEEHEHKINANKRLMQDGDWSTYASGQCPIQVSDA